MIDYLDKVYTKIENKNKLLSKLKYYAFLRFMINFFVNVFAPIYFFYTRNKKQYSIAANKEIKNSLPKVIVTMTSFPARINQVWQVIETIFRQTQKPDKIILWLSEKQFPSKKHLPTILLSQIKRGLDIRFVEEDIKSHKKYFYSLKEFPKDYLITVDDDIFYRSKMIEDLISLSFKNKGSVIAQYVRLINFDNGKLEPYITWKQPYDLNEKDNLFFGSGGGTLFPPGSMYPDVLKKELLKTLTPTADDIWLNAMCRLKKTKVLKTNYYSSLLQVFNYKKNNLSSINIDLNQNDIQIEKTRKYYLDNYEIDPFSENQLSFTK
jgi:hypothetical protein